MDTPKSIIRQRAAIEAIKPIFTHPPNLRIFQIGPLDVALIANPDSFGTLNGNGKNEDEGIDPRASIEKIHALDIRWMVAFDDTSFRTIESLWNELLGQKDGKANLLSIPDYGALPSLVLNQIAEIAMRAQKQNSGLLFYCHGGFGRSGTAAASLKLREIIDTEAAKALREGISFKPDLDKCKSLPDIDNKTLTTTGRVARAIEFIREQDPERGNDLRAYNARSSLKGPSVENIKQFESLEALEKELLSKSIP